METASGKQKTDGSNYWTLILSPASGWVPCISELERINLFIYIKDGAWHGAWHRARPPCLLNVGSIYLLLILLIGPESQECWMLCSCNKGSLYRQGGHSPHYLLTLSCCSYSVVVFKWQTLNLRHRRSLPMGSNFPHKKPLQDKWLVQSHWIAC